jgi:GntR family transcriptional repressor for pyruvate dehydrogenase complex
VHIQPEPELTGPTEGNQWKWREIMVIHLRAAMNIKKQKQSLDRTAEGSGALYSQIVERIKQWVRDGDLKEGDVLPSERELAEVFGVSRVPVREALKSLQVLGIVTNIRGKGVVIKKASISDVISNMDPLLDPVSRLYDLFDVREAIEGLAARLAAQRRTPEELEWMEEYMVEHELEILRDRPVRQASVKFHNAIILASRNEIVIRINEMLRTMLMHSRQETLRTRKQRLEALAGHRKIVEAIRKQDAEAARAQMLHHLAEVRRMVPTLNIGVEGSRKR